jgi:AraC-like DNA-binding protein
MFDFLSVLNLLGIIQGFILTLSFLFSKSDKIVSNRLLGCLLLCLTLTITEIFGCYTRLIAYFPFFINTTEALDFLLGPLLYFYCLSLTKPVFNWKNKWLHFIPAILFFILRVPFLLQSNAFKIADVDDAFGRIDKMPLQPVPILWFPHYHFGGFWMDVLTFPHQLIYYILNAILIYNFTRGRNESFWNSSLVAVRWLSRIATMSLVFLIIAMFLSFSSDGDTGDIYIASALSGVFYLMSYMLLRHSQLLSVQNPDTEKKKYEKSGLSEEIASNAMQKLNNLMQTEKPYLNPDITLPELASKLHISTHHLSQLLNEQIGKNFSDFLNEYRIEEMKYKLLNPTQSHLKIEEMAFESGFNSKSVFNTAFKKFTGQTPSEYRKSANTKKQT